MKGIYLSKLEVVLYTSSVTIIVVEVKCLLLWLSFSREFWWVESSTYYSFFFFFPGGSVVTTSVVSLCLSDRGLSHET